jgi:Fe-S cluster biosynthesis and repair protein YggX
MVNCIKLKREAEGLDYPPYPVRARQEALGKRLEGGVEGMARAPEDARQREPPELADPRARKYLEEQMRNHFFGGGADAAAGYVPKE